MKKIIEDIFRNKGLLISDKDMIFEAMSEILHSAANFLQESEPYATKTIYSLNDVSRDISDVDDFIDHYTKQSS
jgi:hypothetical protein